jgi:hypothetical protein
VIVLRRLGLLVLAAGALSFAWAAPAAAHAGGLVATDARSRVVGLSPAVPGLSVTTIDGGAKLRLINRTAGPVTVVAGGGPDTPATVAAGHDLTWTDTRSTPVGRKIPAGGAQPWAFTVDAAGTPVTVTGALAGEPRPAPLPWWTAALVTAAAVPLLGRRVRRGDLLIAGTGLAGMAASIAHVTGSTMAVQSAPALGTFVNASGVNLLSWPLILGGAVAVLRGRPAGVLAICAGAALTALFILPDVTAFHRAVLPFAGPPDLERILVVLALGLGSGVAIAGARVLRTLALAGAPA